MKGGKHRNGHATISQRNNHAMTSVYRYDPVAREMTCDFGGVTNVYRYDVDGRLTAVSIPGEGWATYSYNALGQNDAITLPGGTRRMLTYDAFGRLSGQSVQDSGGNALLSQAYQRSLTGRLETKTTDAGVWNYGYDLTDQVTNAVLSASAGSDGAWGYQYDPMGNRKATSALSASSGTSELSVYSANNLNQYTAISNQQSAISNPTYDLNGNMTSCALMNSGTNELMNFFYWDLQNQLILVSNAAVQVSNSYDAMGRRVRKTVSAYNSSTSNYEPVTTNFFFYDGWNMVRETVQLNAPTPPNALTNCYAWGNDLSGSLQGAGGVGGLLAVTTLPTVHSPLSTVSYPLYDHNGNVERYVARNGATVASFQYDAFGNTVASALMNAGTNELMNFSFRFSTKYWDAAAGLYYYGYRYYCPWLGRWVNRDPIIEMMHYLKHQLYAQYYVSSISSSSDLETEGLYQFASNNSIGEIDLVGLASFDYFVVRLVRAMEMPEASPLSLYGEIRDGFEVEYAPKDMCKCPKDKIKLIAAISMGSGGAVIDTTRDILTQHRIRAMPLPSSVGFGGLHNSGRVAFRDAPYSGIQHAVQGNSFRVVYSFEVCAMCEEDTLGCVTFSFSTDQQGMNGELIYSRMPGYTGPLMLADLKPTKLFLEAWKNWSEIGGKPK